MTALTKPIRRADRNIRKGPWARPSACRDTLPWRCHRIASGTHTERRAAATSQRTGGEATREEKQEEQMSRHYATYSPEDDKIRLYLAYRLSAEEYAPVKAAGYHSAPKQGFVFAFWSPKAEDIALELCGEIEDEDKTLVERAEERAERFEDYSDARRQDAEQAHKAVSAIADNIPLGQPILVGHHSEKHARREAEKIENGMRKAVNMWKTSQYWKDRAAGALAHAKYKERPDVRARRIKTLEAELRKCIASYTPLTTKERPEPMYCMQQDWHKTGAAATREEREAIEPELHVWVGPPGRGGHWAPVASLPGIKAAYARTEEHLMHRLEYEHAMLAEKIGADSFASKFDLQIGGKVLSHGAWVTILKLNQKDGITVSVSTNSTRWTRVVPVEEIQDYQPPEEGATELVKAATKRPPLCNYPGEGFATCTMAQWKKIGKDYKSTIHRIQATDTYAEHCVRYAIGVWLNRPPMPEGMDEYKQSQWKMNERHNYYPVFITDEKRKDPPAPTAEAKPTIEPPERVIPERTHQPKPAEPDAEKFEALQESLKAGVQVVSANQLFPTPTDLARRMVEEAEIDRGMAVLEPSAGTGSILTALMEYPIDDSVTVRAIEMNYDLSRLLSQRFEDVKNERADFLELKPREGEAYDRILMNPPFENGADIKHIMHALTFLKPGGRLVAICANGPRQNDKLKPLADSWEELPAGTFEGTQVRSVLLVINKPGNNRVTETEESEPKLSFSFMGVSLDSKPKDPAPSVSGGRSWQSLKESKSFDTERLNDSPLFARRLF